MECVGKRLEAVSTFEVVKPLTPQQEAEVKAIIEARQSQEIQFIGMALLAINMHHIKKPYEYASAIPILLGSALWLRGFHQTHPLKVERKYNFKNIAKVSALATLLIGFNLLYLDRKKSDFCEVNPTNWMCHPDQ